MIIIAHNIRSLHNVGSIFRSADAFALEKIWLTGYTATPPRSEIHKTALGSEDRVAWEFRANVLELIQDLRKNGTTVIGLDNAPGARDIREFSPVPSLALVLGNEVEGIEEEVRTALDGLVEIPMPGTKRSLNVSVATGIALFVLTS